MVGNGESLTMKACAHCGVQMADAANRCPDCGMAVGGQVLRDLRMVDKVLGEDSRSSIGYVLIFVVLLLAAALLYLFG